MTKYVTMVIAYFVVDGTDIKHYKDMKADLDAL